MAKVLSLFEVSGVSDLICLRILKMTFIDANAVFASSEEEKSHPNVLIFLKGRNNFCSHGLNPIIA